ncbi:MAG: hypothetical protein V1761_01925 [bacterium]
MLFKKMLVGVASLVISLGLFVGCGTVAAEDAYVTLDINPSIDLTVNGKDVVLDANALNEDGDLLLLELDLIGEDLEDAIAMIIDKAIDLGFIDIEAAETLVSVSAIATTAEYGETIRNRVMEQVNAAFQERAMMGKAVAKTQSGSTIAEAADLGTTPEKLNLAKKACELDDELTLEQAVAMETVTLMARIQTKNAENKGIAQDLKDEFQAARALIQDEYQPQIQALVDEIAALAAADGDTSALEAELATLRTEFQTELAALRDEYHTDSQAVREQMQTNYDARINEHATAVAAYRAQTQTRTNQMGNAIENYQKGLTTTNALTSATNTNTSGTGGN